MGTGISRRDVLKTLGITAAAGSVLQVIPAKAAEFAHQAVHLSIFLDELFLLQLVLNFVSC